MIININKFKWLLCSFCLAGLVTPPHISYADQPEPTIYVVRCDKSKQQLTIAETSFVPSLDDQVSKKEVLEFTINPGTLTKIGGTDMRPLQLPAGNKAYQCQLGNASYRIEIEPYIFNSNVMGQCGAADPVVSLSVSRDGKQLFSKINFDSCYPSRTIHRIHVIESTNSIKVLALLEPPVRVERTFPLTSFPKEWEKAIFEDYPTGDINVDLFIAVYKRDISAIQQTIKQGANPNAIDVMGFPPLALLGNGREAAYRNKTLEEFDHLSEEIAKILFAAGASGKATRNDGVMLLDYLIGGVPATVIDLLLANGASAREGYPLWRAVSMGDAKLAKKLISAGAEPNRKNLDRTSALYWASVSGFYTRWGQDTPAITEYAKCVKLLLQHGAKVEDAVADQEGLLWILVRSFGKDKKLKLILTELMPYTDRDSIDRAQKLADKMAIKDEGYSEIARWIRLHKNFRKLLKIYRSIIKIL